MRCLVASAGGLCYHAHLVSAAVLPSALFSTRATLLLCVGLPLAAAVQNLLLATQVFEGRSYTHFNNYVIFVSAFEHLRAGLDLYALHPDAHYDLFKYSPTFALAMGPFSILPHAVGLPLWSLLNGVVLWSGLRALPDTTDRQRAWMAWFLAPDLLTSSQNAQCNLLVTGLLLLAFSAFERRQVHRAAAFIALTFFIKVFGLVAAATFVLFHQRLRFLGYLALSMTVLALAPLAVVGPTQLVDDYLGWLHLLRDDHAAWSGLSLMGGLQAWLGTAPPKLALTAGGLVLLLAPLGRVSQYESPSFRRSFFAALLVWLVIFNHRAESATMVVGMAGVALWALSGASGGDRLQRGLALLAFVFTGLAPTDLWPLWVRREVFRAWVVPVVPLLAVWLAINARLWKRPHLSN